LYAENRGTDHVSVASHAENQETWSVPGFTQTTSRSAAIGGRLSAARAPAQAFSTMQASPERRAAIQTQPFQRNQLEHACRERPADRGRAERPRARDRTEHGELGALRASTWARSRRARASPRFVGALVLGGEERAYRTSTPAPSGEQETSCTRADQLIHHELQLLEDHADVYHREVGKGLRQARGQQSVAGVA